MYQAQYSPVLCFFRYIYKLQCGLNDASELHSSRLIWCLVEVGENLSNCLLKPIRQLGNLHAT